MDWPRKLSLHRQKQGEYVLFSGKPDFQISEVAYSYSAGGDTVDRKRDRNCIKAGVHLSDMRNGGRINEHKTA